MPPGLVTRVTSATSAVGSSPGLAASAMASSSCGKPQPGSQFSCARSSRSSALNGTGVASIQFKGIVPLGRVGLVVGVSAPSDPDGRQGLNRATRQQMRTDKRIRTVCPQLHPIIRSYPLRRNSLPRYYLIFISALYERYAASNSCSRARSMPARHAWSAGRVASQVRVSATVSDTGRKVSPAASARATLTPLKPP